MEERNMRSTLQGVVASTKMDKTIVVVVSTKRNHPLYQKRVGYDKKYYVHDENNEAMVGDTVTIMACRPISKSKRFRLVSIDKHGTAARDEVIMEKLEVEVEQVEAKEEK